MSQSSFYDPSTAEYLDPQVKRKVAIVTGANSGIGWFTALHLYLHGYVVYLAGRNEAKVEKAIADIKQEAEKRTSVYTEEEKKVRIPGRMSFIYIDCCNLKSVVDCATDFLAKEPKLDILINNAGLLAVAHEITKDGYESQYQVNAVAPLLFTLKLTPALAAATTKSDPLRVVCVSSMGHHMSRAYYSPTDTLKRSPNAYFAWLRYANAKGTEIHFMKKFAQLHPDILAYSVHPGVIMDTGLWNYWKSVPYVQPFFKIMEWLASKTVCVTPEEGSLASLRAALDHTHQREASGSYLSTGGVLGRPSSVVLNPEYIDRAWTENLELLASKGYEVA